jgi:hypothetical protein
VSGVWASLARTAGQALGAAEPRAADWFTMTDRLRRGAFGACLAGMAHLPVRLPGVTTRLFEHAVRLPGGLRVADGVYRRVFAAEVPGLARIGWPRGEPARLRAWLRRLSGVLRRRAGEPPEAIREVLRAEVAGLPDGLGEGGTDEEVLTVKHFARRHLG